MKNLYLATKELAGGELRDLKACLELVKDNGGEIKGPFFPLRGFVVEVEELVADALGLVLFN